MTMSETKQALSPLSKAIVDTLVDRGMDRAMVEEWFRENEKTAWDNYIEPMVDDVGAQVLNDQN
jgi:hypothetical protein